MYPRILHIYGPLWINGYGSMIATGFLLFIYLTYKHPLRKKSLSGETYLNTLFAGLISAIIGGRFLFVISNLNMFKNNPLEIFYPWIGGFCLLGSILGILVTIPLYLRKQNIAVLPLADLISLYAPLLQAISRIGCFLAGCCYGIAINPSSILSVTFTNLESLAPLNIPLHPTQLYSSAASLLIFFILQAITTLKKVKVGIIFFLYLLLESIARFTVDFWRADRDIIKSYFSGEFPLSLTQLIAISIFVCTLCALIFNIVKKQNNT